MRWKIESYFDLPHQKRTKKLNSLLNCYHGLRCVGYSLYVSLTSQRKNENKNENYYWQNEIRLRRKYFAKNTIRTETRLAFNRRWTTRECLFIYARIPFCSCHLDPQLMTLILDLDLYTYPYKNNEVSRSMFSKARARIWQTHRQMWANLWTQAQSRAVVILGTKISPLLTLPLRFQRALGGALIALYGSIVHVRMLETRWLTDDIAKSLLAAISQTFGVAYAPLPHASFITSLHDARHDVITTIEVSKQYNTIQYYFIEKAVRTQLNKN